ncbi:uncharacterized serine-rich protein C215.13-like [Malania oleifera]|uniref:uncharacterized serine-rich protein C215.13-like n=1 Tax=Malania oleifera TaxID=397392 RepID=UPI0025ADD00D|nr:uncharacterized serine-rich protein C215.13-like [Malania oleifera]
MDSGNSGSMQSSSGGDEEYDSRAETIPTFLNPSAHFSHNLSNPHHPAISLLDPPNYFETFSQTQSNPNPNASSLLSHDVFWSIMGSSSSSSSSSSAQASILGSSQGPMASQGPLRPVHDHNDVGALAPSDQPTVGRSSKKRTRASRRAPTTVLTTDTSNFRAMVQEYTGIPPPPFSAAPSYSRRLDLFSSAGATMRSSHLEPLGSIYPLRPSALKIQPISPFLSSSSPSLSSSFLNSTMVDAIAATANIATSSTTTTNNITMTTSSMAAAASINLNPSTSINYQQPQNPLNMQNPYIKFHSLLQSPLPNNDSPLKFPLSELPVSVPGKSQGNSDIDSNGVNHQELGMSSHGHGNANLGGFLGTSSHQDHRLRSFTGNYGDNSSVHVSSFKLNCAPGPSSENNVSSRAEGTVDSWICPSD